MSYLSQIRKDNKIFILTKKHNGRYDYNMLVFDSDVDEKMVCCSCVKYLNPKKVCELQPSTNMRLWNTFSYESEYEDENLLEVVKIDTYIFFIWDSKKVLHVQHEDEPQLDLCDMKNISDDLLAHMEKNEIYQKFKDNALSPINQNSDCEGNGEGIVGTQPQNGDDSNN